VLQFQDRFNEIRDVFLFLGAGQASQVTKIVRSFLFSVNELAWTSKHFLGVSYFTIAIFGHSSSSCLSIGAFYDNV
jgi:hypothetical protein